jgi:hypothetical protein
MNFIGLICLFCTIPKSESPEANQGIVIYKLNGNLSVNDYKLKMSAVNLIYSVGAFSEVSARIK